MTSRASASRAPQGAPRLDVALGCVALAALLLRLAGIGWGLPDATHYFSYHPDEFETAGRAIRILNTGDWNPEFFNYGSLYLYLTTILAWPFYALGIVKTVTGTHVVARVLSAVLGAGTTFVAGRIGARLDGRAAGLLAALFVALAPGHVLHSSFATVDVTATFFVALALDYALRALDSPQRRRLFAFAGLAAGFAAGTKYGAGLVLVAPLAAALLAESGNALRARVTGAAAAAGAALVAFAASIPYAFVVPGRFREDVAYELFVHPREGHVDIFRNTGDGWSYHLLENLPYALGIPLLALSLAGVAWWLVRRRRADIVLLLFALPYFAGIGLSKVRFLRYTLPLVPVLAVAAASLLEKLAARPRGRVASNALAPLALVWCALLSTIQLAAMLRPDPRTRAAQWIEEHVPPGSTIGLPTVPWFTTAAVTPWNGGERSHARFEQEPSRWRFLLCENWSMAPFERSASGAATMSVFVMSEYDWRDARRLDEPRARAFLATLSREYALSARFQSIPLAWRRLYGNSFAPHDWLYPFAEVQVWARR